MKRTWRVPTLGDELPRRGNRLLQTLAGSILRAWGWQFEGDLPNVSKAVAIVVPHTSNWDFVVGVLGVFAVGVRVSWLGKHTIFRPPWGGLMRWLGGIPIDRRSSAGVVEQIVELFDSSDALLLGLSPEGTRRQVERWRTGFYHIAHGVGCVIVPIAFDYGSRTIRFGPPLMPTGAMEADLTELRRFFAGVQGRKPELGPTSSGTG